jgi:hypothetical protein
MAAVDRLLDGEERVYVEVVDEPSAGPAAPERVSARVQVYRLDLALMAHRERLRGIVGDAELVYVHTVHLARHVLPYYPTGKVVTDFHGAAPEEERLFGRTESARFYDEVETVVLAESRYAVVVTQAMAEHLRRKHPGSRTDFVVLPVLDTPAPVAEGDLPPRARSGRPTVIYSGAAQRWQNVELMLELARDRLDRFDFTFLSGDPALFEQAAARHGVRGRVAVRFAPKAELPALYRQADYGLVLRDDDVVNRVACPTKLAEYLAFGVIPVVKSPELGDFPALGYRYVTLEDFRAGRLPDAEEQRKIRRQNLGVVDKLRAVFEDGASRLRQLPGRLPRGTARPPAGRGDLEWSVVFPAVSELTYAVAGDAGAERCVLTRDFAGPYHAVEFDLGPAAAAAPLTWMPINRECQITLTRVSITDDAGRPIGHRMSGNHAAGRGERLTFHTRAPRLSFDLEPGRRPRRFRAELDLLLVGDEVYRATGARAADPGRRSRLRAAVASWPPARAAYRRLVGAARRLRWGR